MPKEIANRTQKDLYYKCTHCKDEVFWNTNKKLIYCKCKKLWVDGCEDYIRIGGLIGGESIHFSEELNQVRSLQLIQATTLKNSYLLLEYEVNNVGLE